MRIKPRRESVCPGCRSRLPANPAVAYEGYYHCSAECWGLYSDVLGFEFGNAVVFSQVHHLTVDAYAVQHAGGRHKDKSMTVHLIGLYAAFELKICSRTIPGLLQRVAAQVDPWPHFEPPGWTGPLTIVEVALADSPNEHIARVRKWAKFVWQAWAAYHAEVAAMTQALVGKHMVQIRQTVDHKHF